MRQGILIAAYKEFDHLIEVIGFFDHHFDIFIHIDKKSTPPPETLDRIRAMKNVKFLASAYPVNWSGTNHLKCILLLAGEALKNADLSYIHLISGQDFPAKDLGYFARFPQEQGGKDFLGYFSLPSTHWSEGGLPRVEYYHFYDLLDPRKYRPWLNRIVKVQSMLHIKRRFSKKWGDLYGGSTWWSLSRETLAYVIDYTRKDPSLLKRLEHTFCPDEVYFQTVIMNSPYAQNVVDDDLRYVDWGGSRNGSLPAVLDDTDFDKIAGSNALFARKFQHPVSDSLRAMLTASR